MPADFDSDQYVDSIDFAKWEMHLAVDDVADADEDGDTDWLDFLVWQQNYGTLAPALGAGNSVVPEPSPLWLGAMTSIGLMFRRRFSTR